MLSILKETKDYIIVNKPGGLITERNPFEDSLETQVYDYLGASQKQVFLGVVHRLDRVTSGVVLFAKKKSALKYFNQLFESKTIQKTYLAICNRPIETPKAKLIHYLGKDLKQKKAIVYKEQKAGSKKCELSYARVGVSGEYTLLQVSPKTGRFHQIRAQLSFLNLPIYGDTLYGSTDKYQNKAVCLHAYSLEFTDFNSTEKVKIHAPIPSYTPWEKFTKLVQSRL